MPTYPGDTPSPRIESYFSPLGKDITMSEIHIGSHFGTHIDAPRHFYPNGKMLSDFAPERFVGNAICLKKPSGEPVPIDLTDGEVRNIREIKPSWILIHTGFDKNWLAKRYFHEHPYLSDNFARKIVDLRLSGVGIDFPSADSATSEQDNFPVHHILMKAEVLILENLTGLEKLPDSDFFLAALPMNLKAEAAPTRVIGIF
ncbi:MAG: hypothetical protein COT43_08600 [Candidatus Marinimicrobia bacterium CG08_land_8_20_14_0_20_45_22]|nr:MAG: hypothetical protein COT43_08600 [Candidatus Marinimicrobia bacterium CG08_land_8_20_14_0_20_45_22]